MYTTEEKTKTPQQLRQTDHWGAIAARAAFFTNRVKTYATRKGFCNRGVIINLEALAALQENGRITAMVDAELPAELRSGNMPVIGEEVIS